MDDHAAPPPVIDELPPRIHSAEINSGKEAPAPMPSNPRLDRIETNLEKLTQVTGALAASITAHDDQIENLLHIAEIQQQRWEQLQREWQAYLTTIHPRQ